MEKVIFILLVIGFIGQTQTMAQNSTINNDHKYDVNLNSVHQYISDNKLAICSKNYKFIGIYYEANEKIVCSIFSGDYDVINERKIIASKIYYVAGLTKCSDKEFNDTSSLTTRFHIDLGNDLTVRYYNFSGNVNYKNRKLIHIQTTDILNPEYMNAMYKTIDVVYSNIYFPEAYGLDYNYKLDFTALAKKSIETLYKDFHKIETEYKKL